MKSLNQFTSNEFLKQFTSDEISEFVQSIHINCRICLLRLSRVIEKVIPIISYSILHTYNIPKPLLRAFQDADQVISQDEMIVALSSVCSFSFSTEHYRGVILIVSVFLRQLIGRCGADLCLITCFVPHECNLTASASQIALASFVPANARHSRLPRSRCALSTSNSQQSLPRPSARCRSPPRSERHAGPARGRAPPWKSVRR
jgi:hypothetical protein